MFSLQTLFGRGARTLDLLVQSAQSTERCAVALGTLVSDPQDPAGRSAIDAGRRRVMELSDAIAAQLPGFRSDQIDAAVLEQFARGVEGISGCIERFAERFAVVGGKLGAYDFRARVHLLQQATALVVEMVGRLEGKQGLVAHSGTLQALRRSEQEAEKQNITLFRSRDWTRAEPIEVLFCHDLYDLLDQAIGRCKRVGELLYGVALRAA